MSLKEDEQPQVSITVMNSLNAIKFCNIQKRKKNFPIWEKDAQSRSVEHNVSKELLSRINQIHY